MYILFTEIFSRNLYSCSLGTDLEWFVYLRGYSIYVSCILKELYNSFLRQIYIFLFILWKLLSSLIRVELCILFILLEFVISSRFIYLLYMNEILMTLSYILEQIYAYFFFHSVHWSTLFFCLRQDFSILYHLKEILVMIFK